MRARKMRLLCALGNGLSSIYTPCMFDGMNKGLRKSLPIAAFVLCAWFAQACDSYSVLEEPDSGRKEEETGDNPQIRDSTILAFSVCECPGIGENGPERIGFYNVETRAFSLLPQRSVSPPAGVEEYLMTQPMVSPTDSLMLYFNGGASGAYLVFVTGATVDDFTDMPRKDVDVRVSPSNTYWSGDGASVVYRGGSGIAGDGRNTSRADENGHNGTVVEGFIPIGRGPKSSVVLREYSGGDILLLPDTTDNTQRFPNPRLGADTFSVDWSDADDRFVIHERGRGFNRIIVTDYFGVTRSVVDDDQNDEFLFWRPLWGEPGVIYYTKFNTIERGSSVIIRHDIEAGTTEQVLSAADLGFSSNQVQLGDVWTLPRRLNQLP